MGQILYCHKFFQTENDARKFIRQDATNKQSGQGTLYKNTLTSRSKRNFHIEADMAGLTMADRQKTPFCVAWNHILQ